MENVDLKCFEEGLEITKISHEEDILLLEGKPVFICKGGEIYPTLLNEEVLKKLPTFTVDMGAVPHICNGADLMVPGIVKISSEFQAGALAVVVDVRFSKPIAIVRTLYRSEEFVEKKRGKVAENVHYVGDPYWKLFKQVKN